MIKLGKVFDHKSQSHQHRERNHVTCGCTAFHVTILGMIDNESNQCCTAIPFHVHDHFFKKRKDQRKITEEKR